MVKKSSETGGLTIAPFLSKCYEMVDDPSTDALISWSPTSDSFIVWNESEFTSELLPKYFKHSNYASFQRQLNIYVRFLLFYSFLDFLTGYLLKDQSLNRFDYFT